MLYLLGNDLYRNNKKTELSEGKLWQILLQTVQIMIHMNNRPILDIRHFANRNRIAVTSQNTLKPNCGCTIHSGALIGMGATVLNHAEIGENSLIGAGSLVTE
jgi:acetyltransferase-like isoleucine patch superfamily enzyme